jgi:hypothetical protein
VKIFRAFLLVCGNPTLQYDFTDLGDTPSFLCGDRRKVLLQVEHFVEQLADWAEKDRNALRRLPSLFEADSC